MLKNASWIWCNDDPERCNQYGLFRRHFELPADFGSVHVHACADMRYWLYVNGHRIGFGPGKFNPTRPLYDSHDITPWVTAGRNTIAVKVHGIGMVERCSSFIPTRCALIGAIRWNGGEIVTNSEWRAIEETAYAADTPRFAAHQSFIECFDGRTAQLGWHEPGFDDGTWQYAHQLPDETLAPWTEPTPKPVANLTLTPRHPLRVIETGISHAPGPVEMADLAESMQSARRVSGPGVSVAAGTAFPLQLRSPSDPKHAAYAVLDFGENAAGYLCFRVSGASGTVVDIGYGEEFDYGVVRCNLQGIRYVDRFILNGSTLEHQLMFPKMLRYLVVDVRNGEAEFDEIRQDVSVYPVQWQGGFVAGERPVLAGAWRSGAYTVNQCMEDVYMDTPRRERAGWLGDLLPEAMATYYAFGETTVARHSLDLFMSSQHEEGWVEGRYPSIDGGNMPNFSAALSTAVVDYAMYSGDVALAEQSWPTLERLTQWFEGFRRQDDLIRVVPQARSEGVPPWGGYTLVDWSPILLKGVMSSLNMFYVRYLTDCATIARMLGHDAEAGRYDELASVTRAAVQTHLFDECRGIFVNLLTDDGLSRRAGYQENMLALLWDIATPEQASRIEQALLPDDGSLPIWTTRFRDWAALGDGTEPWNDEEIVPIGSPFFMYYALGALFAIGRGEKALNTIEHRYSHMLARGSTLWEDFSGDTSRSHGWSAGPTALLSKYILGVAPQSPGFASIDIMPEFAGLTDARGRVPTPHGVIDIAWQRDGKATTLDVVVPEGAAARVGLPHSSGVLLCNGAKTVVTPHTLRRGTFDTCTVGPGQHHIEMRS
jgi:alpha-L-rhamnosidase